MTRPPSMSLLVWRSLLALPAELRRRVLDRDDMQPPREPMRAADDDSDDDVMAPLRRWRTG